MAANNLRIIYQNLADSGTIIASSTTGSTAVANLNKDPKSLIWRSQTSSTSAVKANIVMSFTSSIIGGVILPFCNLTSAATIRVRGYTGTAPTLGGTVDNPSITASGTLVFDTTNVLATPYTSLSLWGWDGLSLGANSYSYGGGTCARVWFPKVTCTSIVIEIIDTNVDRFVEISRLVVGDYWSPTYNTEFGLSTTLKDLSTSERNESGDLVTNRGARFNSMSFDLNWLKPTDRFELLKILKGNGTAKPLFISLFPDNDTDWSKEQAHQIYGKLSQLGSISHPIYNMYSTQIEIEEL